MDRDKKSRMVPVGGTHARLGWTSFPWHQAQLFIQSKGGQGAWHWEAPCARDMHHECQDTSPGINQGRLSRLSHHLPFPRLVSHRSHAGRRPEQDHKRPAFLLSVLVREQDGHSHMVTSQGYSSRQPGPACLRARCSPSHQVPSCCQGSGWALGWGCPAALGMPPKLQTVTLPKERIRHLLAGGFNALLHHGVAPTSSCLLL